MKRTLKEVKSFINLMKKEGVLSLKVEGLELSIAPQSFIQKEMPAAEEQVHGQFPEPTEEELLYWSSPGVS